MSPNDQEMYRMQQDALRRVWQMQEQARRTVGTQQGQEQNRNPTEQKAQGRSHQQQSRKSPAPPKRYTRAKKPLSPKPTSPGDLIGLLTGGDNDRTLILVLLLLLINEKADTYLILSMLYLLL